MNHHSGEGLPDVSLRFSKGKSQQHQIKNDGESRTFLCVSISHHELQGWGIELKAQAWQGKTCVAQNSIAEFLFLKRAENNFLPRLLTLSLLKAHFRLPV